MPCPNGLLRQSGWDIFSHYDTLIITSQRGGKSCNLDKIASNLLSGWMESSIMPGKIWDSGKLFMDCRCGSAIQLHFGYWVI